MESNLLPVENKVAVFAQTMANLSGESWEIFRDGRGAVDCGLAGTCETAPKFRLLTVVNPKNQSHK